MKPLLLLTVLLALPALLPAQEKGVKPTPITNNQFTNNQTKAVVIGISDYQHKSIEDLRFADRDARAFAEWLASPSGGRLPGENVSLLLNKNATAGQVISALDGLAESCAEGDLLLIYFSGHGDVEKITTRQNGYLLCHDAPATTYPAGGCLPLGYLQDIVSTISEKKARVVLVTDACHAGKLAGSAVNGTQTTNAALARQFAGEVKIMSCQANELALEGEQWGGGRGVFSFHFVGGLGGPADKNADGSVTLREIENYLEDRVTTEAAPHPQTPVTLGDKNFVLARPEKTGQAAPKRGELSATELRGLLDEADSILYSRFQIALRRRDFFQPADSCAEFFYQKLATRPTMEKFHGLLRRNYAAALQDEIQQAINALLDNDPYENNNWLYHPEKYSEYPALLARAIELLGEKHYMLPALRSKKAYFEGYNIAKTLAGLEADPVSRDSLKATAKAKYLEGIGHDPEAAYLYFAIGDLYMFNNPYQTDSVALWCSRAFDLSPGWVTPALEIFYEYKSPQGNADFAEEWLRKALDVLPNSYLVQERLAWLRQSQGKRDEAVQICEKMIAEKPDLFNAYGTLGYTFFIMDGDYPETEKALRKAVELNSSLNNWAYPLLGASIIRQRRVREGIDLLLKVLASSDFFEYGHRLFCIAEGYYRLNDFEKSEQFAARIISEKCTPFLQMLAFLRLGQIRVRQNRLPEAAIFFEKSLAADSTPNGTFILDWALLGEVARLQGKPAEAEAFFKKALAYESGSAWEDMLNKDEAHYRYGHFLLRQNRDAEAREQFQKSLDMRKKGFWGEYGFALLAAKQGDKTTALDWLERSLDNFFPDEKMILEEPLFEKIRKTKRFEALMEKHFAGE